MDLTNGESATFAFGREADGTIMMRVPNTECDVDAPCPSCVAVRWNLSSGEGVVLDLFKAQKGVRAGCNLSSVFQPSVRWGQLMLRIVDDVAIALGIRHVYLADEASVLLSTWPSGGARVMLRYLLPLLRGVGYYEPFGYFTVTPAEYYGGDGVPHVAAAATRARAFKELDALNAMRSTPFQGGVFAAALRQREGSRDTHKSRAFSAEQTLIYRFGMAVAAARVRQPKLLATPRRDKAGKGLY